MLDFDLILVMDLLHSCYAFIDCRTRVIKFQLANYLILKLKGGNYIPRGQFVSYINSSKMMSKG